MRKVIDVSTYQGYIHWHKVAVQAGLDAVILKATDGDWEDNKSGVNFTGNFDRALRAGLRILGGYGYYYLPRPEQTGWSQAACLLRLLPKGVMPIGDYEPPINVQWKPQYTEDARIYFDVLDQSCGYPVPIYTGEPYINRLAIRGQNGVYSWPEWVTIRPLLFSAYPYRLPYGNRKLPPGEKFDQWNLAHRTYSEPGKPIYWTDWPGKLWLWQFDANGVIPGIPGNSTDLNYEWNQEHWSPVMFGE